MACETSATYKIELVNDMAVKIGTKRTFLCTFDKATQYTIYSYKFNITGEVTLEYNNTNGHLIATFKNGFIQPAGSGTWPTQKPFAAPWYGDLTSPLPCWRSIAMAVSTSPDIPAAGWKKCLGGWYSAGTNCNTTCTKDKYGNPPGGTWTYFSDTQTGTPWEKTQYQRGGRTVPTQTWDLGAIQSSDGQDLQIYLFARAEQACAWNQPACENMPWANSSIPRVTLTAPVCPLDPPVLESVTQESNVCNNCVDAYVTFAAQDFEGQDGVLLTLDYKYGEGSWDDAMFDSQELTAYSDWRNQFKLPCLMPEREVCWRARYVTTRGTTSKSDYTYGCFKTGFVPPVWMEVPALTVSECTAMSQGKAIPEYDYVIDYWGNRL